MPLLVAACYITVAQEIEIGPFHFTVVRLLVAAGFVRILVRGERLTNGVNGLDWIMFAWGVVALLSSFGHKDPLAALVFRLGEVYDCAGVYFLIRIFSQSLDDVVLLVGIVAIVLVPVALEMLQEKRTAHNYFSVFGGVSPDSYIREGKIRAQGPFKHAILAGTVGAVCFPLMAGLWKHRRKISLIGLAATVFITYACASSGPLMSAMAAAFALFLWRYRHHMRFFRWVALLGYVGLDLLMKDPAYYLMARIDLTGGSTGWHRAQLIHSAFKHLNEWWLTGTDYTRDWMPTGVSWSPDHTDITNQYLMMGVLGGLPLMFLFIAMLARAFSFVGQVLRQLPYLPLKSQYLVWAMGASLFAQAATCVSVSYFDQSFVFLYLTLGAIGSTKSWSLAVAPSASATEEVSESEDQENTPRCSEEAMPWDRRTETP
jgi:hypothetical protein